MSMFSSMAHIVLFTALTVLVLLWIAIGRQPVPALAFFVQRLRTSRIHLVNFVAMLAILLFNKIEVALEYRMAWNLDITPAIYRLEGHFVYWVQELFQHPWLTTVLAFFYVVVFQSLLVGSLVLYAYERSSRLYHAVCYAIMINYMIAIPFYLFFPVTEVHAFSPDVRFLMLDVFPNFESTYRNLSDLDNCFPSLHTSISVSLSMIALRSGNRFWRRFVPVAAGIVIFSIFYLGIHWLTDMLGGTLLGLFAARAALRIGEGRPVFGDLPFPGKRETLRKTV